MSIVFRPATRADLPAIREVLVETWHDTYDALFGRETVADITGRWHSLENLARQLDAVSPDNVFLVAEQAGRICGTASVARLADGNVELGRLYVLPAFQGRGTGRALLRAALAPFPEAASVRLEVEPRNAKAIAFYARHGFSALERGPACGGDSKAAIAHLVMTARLPLLALRPARDEDAQDLFGLMSLCFSEYPGCFVDPHDDLPDLVRPGHWPERRAADGRLLGGEFLVLEDERGRICASVAVDFPHTEELASEVAPGSREANSSGRPELASEVAPGSREANSSGRPELASEVVSGSRPVAELHRLYVRPDCRRRGIAGRLVAVAEGLARAGGASRMILWSDTRFEDAHRLYRRLGYGQGEAPRELSDISRSWEYSFSKVL